MQKNNQIIFLVFKLNFLYKTQSLCGREVRDIRAALTINISQSGELLYY
jgi:hypothetical protein